MTNTIKTLQIGGLYPVFKALIFVIKAVIGQAGVFGIAVVSVRHNEEYPRY